LSKAEVQPPTWLSRYRRFWTESFDKMDAYLAELKAKEKRK